MTLRSSWVCGALCAFLLVVCASSAAAATITPTRFDDPSGSGNCPSDCSLRQAIPFAKSRDTIQLKTGTYSLDQGVQLTMPNGVDIAIVGNGAANTKIDIHGDDRVYEMPGGGAASNNRLAGLTIENGMGSGSAGGISVFNGTLTVDGVTVANNTGSSGGDQNNGGGVQVGSHGTLVMTNSTVTGNTVRVGSNAADGGGVFVAGTATITNSMISDNHAVTGASGQAEGGGVGTANIATPAPSLTLVGDDIANNDAANTCGGLAEEAGHVTVTNSTVEGNSSAFGGGLCEEGGNEVDVTGTVVRNNKVTQGTRLGEGGGAVEDGGGKLVFTNSSLTGNIAEFGGGAVEDGGGSVTFTNTAVSGNHAQFNPNDHTTLGASENGGAGGVGDDGGGSIAILRSTISGNTADGRGGGIQADGGISLPIVDSTIANNTSGVAGGGVRIDAGDTVAFLNDTVSGNSVQSRAGATARFAADAALAGGSLDICSVTQEGDNHCDGHMSLENTIVSGGAPVNCATSGGSDISIDSHGHNIDSGSTCGFKQSGDLSNIDPLLDPLASNGGPTQTEAPRANSPAINGGDNSVCGNAAGLSGPYDQRGAGFARLVAPFCDIGAVEAQGASAPGATAGSSSAPSGTTKGKATRPTIHVAGVPRGCVRAPFRLTITITSSVPLTLVKATRDTHRLSTKRRARQHVRINPAPLKPGRHRVKISAGNVGGTATKTVAFVRCAAARPKPRATPAPRFTG